MKRECARHHHPTRPTARQLEALAAYATEGDRARAARRLGISVGTMRNHLNDVYCELNVNSALEAIRLLGWLKLPELTA